MAQHPILQSAPGHKWNSQRIISLRHRHKLGLPYKEVLRIEKGPKKFTLGNHFIKNVPKSRWNRAYQMQFPFVTYVVIYLEQSKLFPFFARHKVVHFDFLSFECVGMWY